LIRRTLELWQAYELEFVFERGWDEWSWNERRSFLNGNIADLEQVVKLFYSDRCRAGPILRNATVEQFFDVVRADRGYHLTYCKMRDRQFGEQVIRLGIPESVGASVYPTAPSISIGNHDVFNPDRDEYIARASFSFELSSYGTPPYPAEWERLYFGSEAVKELEAKLVEIWGPLGRFWYTDS